MPVTSYWRGDAQPRPQITKITPANVEVGDIFTVTCNRKDISVTATEATVHNVITLMLIAFEATDIAEFQEMTATGYREDDANPANYTALKLTGPDDGRPFTVTSSTTEGGIGVTIEETVAGDAGQNEIQRITLSGTPTGGTFTLTFDGQTTGTIAYNASAATVETALEALSNIASGDADVTGSAGGPWNVEFKQVFANTNVPAMTGSGDSLSYGAGSKSVNVSTVQNGGGRVNQVQQFAINPSGSGETGTFTITFDGQTTGALTVGDSAATVQTALEGLSNLASGDVVVRTGPATAAESPPSGLPYSAAGTYTIEFKGVYAGVEAPLLIIDGSSLDDYAGAFVSTITNGTPFTPCKLQVRTTGSWTLTLTHPITGLLTTSSAMSAVASAAVVKATLGAMTGYSADDFSVVKNNGGGGYSAEYVISFVGSIGGKDFTIWTSGSTTTPGLIFDGSNQTLEITQEGSADLTNEVQYIFWPAGRKATGGTFTVTLDGQTSAAIAYNASAATVQSALEALSNVGASNVTVTGSDGGPWTVEFEGTLAGTPLNQMTTTNTSLTGRVVEVSVFRSADAGDNEIQQISLGGGAAGGTFTLTYSGQTTGNIAYNASAATVQTALIALSNIGAGEVSVAGEDGGPWTATFQAGMGGTNLVAMTGDATNLTGGTVDIGTIQEAEPLVNEVQTVTIEEATGGTFTLTYSAQTTAAIARYAAASTVETAIAALSSVGPGNVSVSGASGGPWAVEFRGTLGGADLALMTGSAASLTGTGTQAFVTSTDTAPTGPNWWNEPENWSANAAPANGDTLIVENSDVPILYGLADLPSITPALLRIKSSMEAAIGLPSVASTNNGNYFEYRATYLICQADKVVVGEGEGSGTPLFRLDTSTRQTEVIVLGTGTPDDAALPAMLWKGTNSASVFRVFKGSAGLAFLAGETAQIATLQVGYRTDVESDAEVASGVGLTVATVQKSGGDLRMETASGSTMAITTDAGLLIIDGEGAVSQLTIRGGTVNYNTTGTLGGNTVVQGEGVLDFSQDMRSKTVTNPVEKYDDTSQIIDPAQTVNTSGNFVIDCNFSALVGINIGRNRRATFAATA